MTKLDRRPFVLIVRDGWGANPYPEWNHANAVHLAKTPVADALMGDYPNGLIHTSGEEVGLPVGVMGNSEVGHQNIGAGRIVNQEIMRITSRIRDGSFADNRALNGAFARARETGGSVHVMGLCSDGRVHSDVEHLYAILALARQNDFDGRRVWVHAFMDGRDTPPQVGVTYLEQIEAKCRELGINPVATVVGRYYAMDRDNRWDRVQAAYDLLVHGRGAQFASAGEAIRHYYDHPSEPSRCGDEFVVPSVCTGSGPPAGRIADGDSVIFFNYRGDRPRELTKALTLDTFPYRAVDKSGAEVYMGFDRGAKLDLSFATMTAYETGLPVEVAFEKPAKTPDILGTYLADLGLRQFRCAETEKYPHVTFFFNDHRDEPFAAEDWALIPSPREVTTYDQKPEMSAPQVADEVVKCIGRGRYDVVIVNFANGDMVGHTGNLEAAIKAVETVDACVGRILAATLETGGMAIVTADHGNCEQMTHPDTGGPHTAHTTYDVDLIVVDDRCKGRSLRPGGCLADIAPTALEMMGLNQPKEMTGRSLL
ncbi:MAG: 2,3-bisphosphoglycerate-independent phosphoglycerate mutase [bacterium]|nr:2,3-bisphosphoglycerate-independent phosphoglycerate mutase [bacterium]